MSIPKKGSRTITIDGTAYRWRVRKKPTYLQGNNWAGITLAVELAQQPGATLIAQLKASHPRNWMQAGKTAITPAYVAQIIQIALEAEWEPAQPGSAFTIGPDNLPEPDSS